MNSKLTYLIGFKKGKTARLVILGIKFDWKNLPLNSIFFNVTLIIIIPKSKTVLSSSILLG